MFGEHTLIYLYVFNIVNLTGSEICYLIIVILERTKFSVANKEVCLLVDGNF